MLAAARSCAVAPLSLLREKRMFGICREELTNRLITRPAWILVFYAIPAGMCTELGLSITFSLVSDPEQSSCWAPAPITTSSHALIIALVQTSLYFLLYPVLGWLTDTLIDRGRAMKCSIYLCWVGSILQVISSCIQYGTCGLPTSIAKYGISLVAFICLMLGTAIYQTDVLGYGLYQLYTPPSFKSFIHWMVWGQFIGFLVSYIAFVQTTVYQANLLLITGYCVFVMCTVAVVIDKCCGHVFEQCDSSGNNNSSVYMKVYQIMKYAKNHTPAQVTYDTYPDLDNHIPRRMSLAKAKYGGPFQEEEVESVKTFWRIVLVFVAMFGFYIPHYLLLNGALAFVNVFDHATTDAGGFGSYILWSCFNKPVIVLVPLLELVILPLFPKLESFLSNPMKGFGYSYLFLIASLVSMLAIDMMGHYVTPNGSFCFLSTGQSLKLSYYYYSIPLFFGGIGNMFGLIFILQFIYSEAPNSMTGMLTGTFYLIRGIYMSIGHYLQVPFSYIDSTEFGLLSCSFWVILINLALCLIGVVVYVIVCSWYRRQKRGDKYGIEGLVGRFNEADIDE